MADDNTSYLIIGHKVDGLLGNRLQKTAVTAINSLPGVLVPTQNGVFYSELYPVGREEAIERSHMDETTQGLVETVTKEMAKQGKTSFNIRRSPAYYQARLQQA